MSFIQHRNPQSIIDEVVSNMGTPIIVNLNVIPNKGDAELLEKCDNELHELLQYQFDTYNKQFAESLYSISTIESKHTERKKVYYNDVLQIWNKLKNATIDAMHNRSTMKVTIIGQYDLYDKPTLEGWARKNPHEMQIIELFVAELRKKNWQPVYKLSDYTVDHDDGMYSGGNEIIISCSFAN